MANKRIELEQYKHFVNLVNEDPNRKTVRRGITIVMISGVLLVFLFFVLGLLSNDLASNPANVLEKPKPEAPSAPTETPGQNQSTPLDSQQPPAVPGNTPAVPGEGAVPQGRSAVAPPATAWDVPPSAPLPRGVLLAQQDVPGGPEGAPQPVVETQPGTPAATPSTQTPSKEGDKEKAREKGPGEQTEGVGNLANLANKLNSRGFQLYLLVLTVALCSIIYLALARARKEGRAK